MRMHNPPHPGEVLKALYLEPLKAKRHRGGKSAGIESQGLYRRF
jgi:plasmid maintenance system antidote protein VapI